MDRLITVAIHTLDKATQLKSLLESEGVNVTLQNVNLATPVISAGVRVRIAESDLPLALRIIENPEIFRTDTVEVNNESHSILVPVDFTEKSLNAARMAFNVADRIKAKVVLLHSFLVPRTNPMTSIGDSLTFNQAESEAEDVEVSVSIAKTARRQMRQLEQELKTEIKAGGLPAIKSSTVLVEGVPEECIGRYIKEHPEVRLLVMGTRLAQKKAHDLAGSITAEVLDSCRIQALTVTETEKPLLSLGDVNNLSVLSHLEQEDFLALDAVNRLLPENMAVNVKVICMPNDRYSKATNEAARRALEDYCAEHFPNYRFTLVEHDRTKPELEIESSDLVVIPSRKKNIFARLFNPGAAHRLLFHTDIPLLVIPV
ncbi:MAG: universal stress protein [Bacteroides sp.]|nr:universal stress protein [Bacteroides sp.]MCM1379793.1 universal stress protein [Bacteroides sp.]MCM1446152.1 universal stress protein [Prevotella sp.]